jgi:hypothetical protein
MLLLLLLLLVSLVALCELDPADSTIGLMRQHLMGCCCCLQQAECAEHPVGSAVGSAVGHTRLTCWALGGCAALLLSCAGHWHSLQQLRCQGEGQALLHVEHTAGVLAGGCPPC